MQSACMWQDPRFYIQTPVKPISITTTTYWHQTKQGRFKSLVDDTRYTEKPSMIAAGPSGAPKKGHARNSHHGKYYRTLTRMRLSFFFFFFGRSKYVQHALCCFFFLTKHALCFHSAVHYALISELAGHFFLAPTTGAGLPLPFLSPEPAPPPPVFSQASAAAVATAAAAATICFPMLSLTWPLRGSGFPDGALLRQRFTGAWLLVAIDDAHTLSRFDRPLSKWAEQTM